MIDHDAKADPSLTPITVLTGFLGAGKTTLLNRILNGDHGLRIAVLVNDFGSINIDADLVVGVQASGDIISLANGCICCSMRDDMLTAVEQLTERPEQPQYIVVEASGVADPAKVAFTFINANLRERVRLDSILCLVDASQLFAAPEQMELKMRQIAYSDMLILSKTDLVGREEVGRIRAWLDEHFPRSRTVEAPRGEVPMEILLSSGRFHPSQMEADHAHAGKCAHESCDHESHQDHRSTFSNWSFETERPLSLEALRSAASKLPSSIYRAKGVVNFAETPDRRAVLQVVGRRVDISLQEEWGERPPLTRIVVIGSPEGIDADALREKFEQCFSA
jgi:G3E family GTPase